MSDNIRVLAKAAGFVGRLIEAGEVFTVSESQFSASWMVKVDESTAETPAQALKYGVKSNGGGRWIVVNNDDDSRASMAFKPDQGDAKALAQAEANRLNAGGLPVLESARQQEDVQKADESLPDA